VEYDKYLQKAQKFDLMLLERLLTVDALLELFSFFQESEEMVQF
jgi:hypothetical protein